MQVLRTLVQQRFNFSLFRVGFVVGCIAAAGVGCTPEAAPPEREADARPAPDPPPTLDAAYMTQVDEAIATAIDEGDIPGAVLLVGVGDHTLHRKAYGWRALEPEAEEMTADTIFDLASLTKPLATATSVMILADRGAIDLHEPVAAYLPAFAAGGKDEITVEQLLLHRGGLAPANPLSDFDDGPEAGLDRIYARPPRTEPGAEFVYTDLGYIVLGKLVEAVDGRPLEVFAAEEIYEPLGMTETMYRPAAELAYRIAPTERRDGGWMRGQVHDPRAWELGGVAGHAGVFSTADDLARYCRMILAGGELDGRRMRSEQAVAEMTAPRRVTDPPADPEDDDVRSYVFDIATAYSSPRGNRLSAETSFGHTGFTGTSLWIDRQHGLYIILLTNRVHPDGGGRVVGLRRRIATLIAMALLGEAEAEEAAESEAAAAP